MGRKTCAQIAIDRLGIVVSAIAAALTLGATLPARAIDIEGSREIKMSWAPPTSGAAVSFYAVYVATDDGPSELHQLRSNAQPETALYGEVGHEYRLSVRAISIYGIEGPASPSTEPIRFVESLPPPVPPPPAEDPPPPPEEDPPPPEPPSGDPPAPTGDFALPLDIDGNGRSDLLLEDTSTHTLMWWRVRPNRVAYLTLGSLGPFERVVGSGDYNGDGFADLLTFDDSTLVLSISFYDADGLAARVGYDVDAGYQVVASDDFDLDGTDDVMMRVPGSSGFQIWSRLYEPSALIQAGAGLSIHDEVIGVGDVTGDGWPDLLTTNGVNLRRFQAIGTLLIGLAIIDDEYDEVIEAVCDTDADGAKELITSRNGTIFLHDGPSLTRSIISGLDGRVMGAGDYDGDGRCDVAVENEDNVVELHHLNGNTVMSSRTVGDYPPAWVRAGWVGTPP